MKRQSVNKALGRLRYLSPQQTAQTVVLALYTSFVSRLPVLQHYEVTERDIDRWFGQNAPVLYQRGFGHEDGVPPSAERLDPVVPETNLSTWDPRLSWEVVRDQDLSSLAMSVRLKGVQGSDRAKVEERLERYLNTRSPNAMEAALRCIAWLESTRFFVSTGLLSPPMLKQLASRFLRVGDLIERRLYEVPLGGNHYLTHATGLFYLGRLLPGTRATDRWARRGYSILAREVLRQFRTDGGNYEQSSGYHLFSLEVVLGATLLLRGQGEEWPPQTRERIIRAAHFAAALARPDGSVPLLGDDDSGRLHTWGFDPRVQEVCAVAALLFDDATLALAAGGAATAVSWLFGGQGPPRLARLAKTRNTLLKSESFPTSGLHVLADDPECHVTLWSRDPSPRSVVGHAHSDHNSVDAWMRGKHILRDPGTGIYLGNTDLRNRLRATAAHSTLTVDGCEINYFDPADIFFMPAVTRSHRCSWLHDLASSSVTTTHNGFRGLPGRPRHLRTAYLDRIARQLTFVDEVTERGSIGRSRVVEAWWHWGDEPIPGETDTSEGIFRSQFSIDGIQMRLYLPASGDFVLQEPFPWSPKYAVVLSGWRSLVRYDGRLPFRMVLQVQY